MFVEDLQPHMFRVYTDCLNLSTNTLQEFFQERFSFERFLMPDTFNFAGVIFNDLKRSERIYFKFEAPLCLISKDDIKTIRLITYSLVSQDSTLMTDGYACRVDNETREKLQPRQSFQTKLYTKKVPCRFYLSITKDVEINLERLVASSSEINKLKQTLRKEVQPEHTRRFLYCDDTYVIDPLYRFDSYQDLLQQETIGNALFKLNLTQKFKKR